MYKENFEYIFNISYIGQYDNQNPIDNESEN